jgi:cell division FtsZ-interacting protein ZapD
MSGRAHSELIRISSLHVLWLRMDAKKAATKMLTSIHIVSFQIGAQDFLQQLCKRMSGIGDRCCSYDISILLMWLSLITITSVM